MVGKAEFEEIFWWKTFTKDVFYCFKIDCNFLIGNSKLHWYVNSEGECQIKHSNVTRAP